MNTSPSDVIDFWFTEIDSKLWFKKDAEFDRLLDQRFSSLLSSAEKSELFDWRATATGRLAEIIVLDQFSRNLHRESAKAFANDPLALALAQEAVACGADKQLPVEQRRFLYMPYMHSESLKIHDVAVDLFTRLGSEETLKYEHLHRDIIVKFARYPHRNAVLGRESSAAELEFLEQPGSSF